MSAQPVSATQLGGSSGTFLALVRVLQVLVLAAFFVSWELASRVGGLHPFLSRPSRVLSLLGQWLTDTRVIQDVQITVLEAVGGWVIGAVAGIAVGYAFGRNRLVGATFDPLLAILSPVSRFIAFPIFVVVFGSGTLSRTSLVAALVFFMVCLPTRAAIANASDRVGPATLAAVAGTLRLSAGFAVAAAVVTEGILPFGIGTA